MQLPIEAVVQLLHEATFAALATHSLTLPGYPFASVVPFAPDEHHRPIMLMSTLAEHTRNVDADARASLLVYRAGGEDVQSGARLTLIGEVVRIEAPEALRERFFRYQPDAASHLSLGDFGFFRIEPRRLRMVAGFGRMGWIEGHDLIGAATIAPDDEARLVDFVGAQAAPGTTVLGVDCYGIDFRVDDVRKRISLATPTQEVALLAAVAAGAMRDYRDSQPTE